MGIGHRVGLEGRIAGFLQLGGGFGLHLLDMLHLETNGVVDFTSHEDAQWKLQFGGEVFIAHRVGLRVGYEYDIYYDLHSLSAGIGYVDTQFALDLGFMREVVQDGRMIIAFGFKYFIS